MVLMAAAFPTPSGLAVVTSIDINTGFNCPAKKVHGFLQLIVLAKTRRG
jgi:hypothetical protein